MELRITKVEATLFKRLLEKERQALLDRRVLGFNVDRDYVDGQLRLIYNLQKRFHEGKA